MYIEAIYKGKSHSVSSKGGVDVTQGRRMHMHGKHLFICS